MRIGILTGGGDVPGLNPCIRSVTLSADDLGWEVVGFRRGWEGVMEIDPSDPGSIARPAFRSPAKGVRGLDRWAAPSSTPPEAIPRTREGGDGTGQVLDTLQKLGIDAWSRSGGDGHAALLRPSRAQACRSSPPQDDGQRRLGNRLLHRLLDRRSAGSVGGDQRAAHHRRSHERIGSVEAVRPAERRDRPASPASSPRSTGTGRSPRCPPISTCCLPLLPRTKAPTRRATPMCVVSEGAVDPGRGEDAGKLSRSGSERGDEGIGRELGPSRSAERLGSGTVIQELAYLMRAGEPDAMDRMVGFAFGGLAVQLLQRGEKGRMVTLTDGNYSHVPVDTLLKGEKKVDIQGLYDRTAYRARLMRVEGMPMFLTDDS
jgi:6-phosphofructokinase 1